MSFFIREKEKYMRTYIFEKNERGGDDNTYEWVAPGVEPQKDILQDLPAEVCQRPCEGIVCLSGVSARCGSK